jgi:ribosomal protein S12 methylthiotransferase accessory factor
MPEVGISHVAEFSSWDQLDIPVFLAFGPLEDSIDLRKFAGNMFPGTETLLDKINSIEQFPGGHWPSVKKPVFSAGKGLTSIDAKVSAMMEAVERASASSIGQPSEFASYSQFNTMQDEVLDPCLLILIHPDQYSDDQELEWVKGYDIMTEQVIWVPVEAATLAYHPVSGRRILSDTPTGLGAGNTIEEAISHGLAEAIEHDAWSLALARSALDSAAAGMEGLFSDNGHHKSVDQKIEGINRSQIFSRIDPDSLSGIPVLEKLTQKIQDAGLRFAIHEITSDLHIPVISVSISGSQANEDGGGLGAHPDARVALVRAFTEAIQQRLVQRLRNVISKTPPLTHWKQPDWESDGQRDRSVPVRSFDQIHSIHNLDILADIRTMLTAIKKREYDHAIVVDLTKQELGIPVVKVIIPGFADYWTSDAPPNWNSFISRVERYHS